MPDLIELRTWNFFDPETRVEDGEKGLVLRGKGAVFNRWYNVGGFREQVSPTAFNKTLKDHPDIRGMFNHDPNFLLGRTKSETMRLSVDERALNYEIDIDRDDSQAMSVAAKIRRGDVDGSSMAFMAVKDTWEEEKDSSGKVTRISRTLEEVRLIETGPVVFPASPTTSVKVRSAFYGSGARIDYEHLASIIVKRQSGMPLLPDDERVLKDAIDSLRSMIDADPLEAPETSPAHTEPTPKPPANVQALRMRLSRATGLAQVIRSISDPA